MSPVTVAQGDSPLILSIPHAATWLPEDITARLTAEGRVLRDTDWHLDQLYDGLYPGASMVRAGFHRYVIDANRDPADVSLYPGQTTTGLVPLTSFDNRPLWQPGQQPSEAERAQRLAAYHAPYHAALAAEIARVKAQHGYAVLYDCHSIRSEIPWLFEGRLPIFNIGTNFGQSCAAEIENAAVTSCQATGLSTVLNGRFVGGWTTRHYGQPDRDVHAIQMELAQSAYLISEAPPFGLSPDKMPALRAHLSAILHHIMAAIAPRYFTAAP